MAGMERSRMTYPEAIDDWLGLVARRKSSAKEKANVGNVKRDEEEMNSFSIEEEASC